MMLSYIRLNVERSSEQQAVSKFCDVLLNVAASNFILKEWEEVEANILVMGAKEAALKMELGNAITEVLTNMLMSLSNSDIKTSVTENSENSVVNQNENISTTQHRDISQYDDKNAPNYTTDTNDANDPRTFPSNESICRPQEHTSLFEHEQIHHIELPSFVDTTSKMVSTNILSKEKDQQSHAATQSSDNHTSNCPFVEKVNIGELLSEIEEHTLPATISSVNPIEIKCSDNVLVVQDNLNTEWMKEIKSDTSHDKIHQLVVKAVNEAKYKQMIIPIDIWDFGGQKDYYMTHQLFITSRGIFVLMFNGSVDIHKHMPDFDFLPGHFGKPTVAVYLLHWVNSILTYCNRIKYGFPRIIFVATHKDKKWFYRTQEARRKQNLFEKHDGLGHLEFKPLIFVDATNPNDPEIKNLKQMLMQRAIEHPRWGEPMPTKWIPLELQLKG
ncbi:unnamed protein product [Mytilus coruscus]|uniref:Uncharacterized protein n=1 Tax=Mytilus coruscus TaxID=42192 RepID=A0A6J8D8Z0_MYTCO|nr:unnamed protein product [Mytilus coruscus]